MKQFEIVKATAVGRRAEDAEDRTAFFAEDHGAAGGRFPPEYYCRTAAEALL